MIYYTAIYNYPKLTKIGKSDSFSKAVLNLRRKMVSNSAEEGYIFKEEPKANEKWIERHMVAYMRSEEMEYRNGNFGLCYILQNPKTKKDHIVNSNGTLSRF